MNIKPNKAVLAAQKAAISVHAGGAYEMKNGKPVLIKKAENTDESSPAKNTKEK